MFSVELHRVGEFPFLPPPPRFPSLDQPKQLFTLRSNPIAVDLIDGHLFSQNSHSRIVYILEILPLFFILPLVS